MEDPVCSYQGTRGAGDGADRSGFEAGEPGVGEKSQCGFEYGRSIAGFLILLNGWMTRMRIWWTYCHTANGKNERWNASGGRFRSWQEPHSELAKVQAVELQVELRAMRVYLAARFERQHEMRCYAEQLRAEGIEVVSTWLEFDSPSLDGFSGIATERRALQAMLCVQQLVTTNVVAVFSDVPHAPDSHGNKHVEMGAALALGKRVLLCGKPENNFHELPDVERFDGWCECFARILELRETDALTIRQAA